MKTVLVLGGGPQQIPLIKMAKEKGYRVLISDYFDNPPGKQYCDEARKISTFSLPDNYTYARENNVDYVLTIGTDQPVYTAAYVSDKLSLPHPITAEQGRLATNKKYMKARMAEYGIPTPKFKVYDNFAAIDLVNLNYPLVLKPVDSQGQRGIFVLQGKETPAELEKFFISAQQFSPTNTVIIEEFYAGEEITVNTWVKDGKTYNLLITDRLHYDDNEALGLCTQQRFPSSAAEGREEEIDLLVQNLVDAFAIEQGPLYIQMIVGHEGLKFVEFGYRIGGGFESETIPLATGIDILDLYFTLVAEGKNKFSRREVKRNFARGSIFFMFAHSGKVVRMAIPPEFKAMSGKLFLKEGDTIGRMENATSRSGCFTIYCRNSADYFSILKSMDEGMKFYDENNRDLLIHGLWQ